MTFACDLPAAQIRAFPDPERDLPATGDSATAVFAAGCFWCVEAVFERLDGVLDVTSGYAGGSAGTADYESVCTGTTDHAEVVRVRYAPARISYGRLLKVLFSVAHDPTQRDRQGNDIGRQYRSAIFYSSDAERAVAAAYIAQLEAARVFPRPIVTVLVPLAAFYEAEAYHQDYAQAHPFQPYIAGVARPKVDKLEHHYADWLRKDG